MIKLITAIFLALGVITSESFAGVRSIVSDSSNSDVAVSGNSNGNECPYDSSYYAGCCLAKYQYLAEDCIAAHMKPSADNCMGYYACEQIETPQ